MKLIDKNIGEASVQETQIMQLGNEYVRWPLRERKVNEVMKYIKQKHWKRMLEDNYSISYEIQLSNETLKSAIQTRLNLIFMALIA